MSASGSPKDDKTERRMPWMSVDFHDLVEEERDTEVVLHPAYDAWQAWLDSMEH